jgi:hypothetical protein
MANIMGILGGLGQGISSGVQSLERMDEAKNRKEEAQFRKELQQRERERLAEEKRLGEAVKGIKRSREGFTPEQTAANTQAGFTNLPTRDDEGRLAYGATETAVPRSEAELLKEEAALYSASPDIKNRTYARQLQGEARVLETQDKIDAEDKEHANTLKAINANPDKWYQENLASFNADLSGGPNTAGYKAFPQSTPQGTVLNIMGPQGQQIQQIPVTREALTRVAKAMYYDKLSTIDKKYAELAMKNEQLGLEREGLGLKRQANETDAQFKARQADYYAGNLALNRDEYNARKAGGMYSRAPERFSPLGLSDDATRMLGVRGGSLAEMPIPAGYSKGSFPKVAEKGSAGVDIRKTDEGFIAFSKTTGKPVYNLGSKGQPLPIGVSESDLLTREKQAASAGIPLEMRSDPESGKLIIGYKGRDGNYYDSLEEARKAKPAKK